MLTNTLWGNSGLETVTCPRSPNEQEGTGTQLLPSCYSMWHFCPWSSSSHWLYNALPWNVFSPWVWKLCSNCSANIVVVQKKLNTHFCRFPLRREISWESGRKYSLPFVCSQCLLQLIFSTFRKAHNLFISPTRVSLFSAALLITLLFLMSVSIPPAVCQTLFGSQEWPEALQSTSCRSEENSRICNACIRKQGWGGEGEAQQERTQCCHECSQEPSCWFGFSRLLKKTRLVQFVQCVGTATLIRKQTTAFVLASCF